MAFFRWLNGWSPYLFTVCNMQNQLEKWKWIDWMLFMSYVFAANTLYFRCYFSSSSSSSLSSSLWLSSEYIWMDLWTLNQSLSPSFYSCFFLQVIWIQKNRNNFKTFLWVRNYCLLCSGSLLFDFDRVRMEIVVRWAWWELRTKTFMADGKRSWMRYWT